MLVWLLLASAVPVRSRAAAEGSNWATFFSRSGWSIRYLKNWGMSSCMACPDPHATDVSVVFAPRGRSGWKSGTVTVTPLSNYALKRSGDPLQNLADDFAQANRVRRMDSHDTVLAGHRALVVRYGHGDSAEIEVTFSFLNSEPIEIEFGGSGPLESLADLPIYRRMLTTFTGGTPHSFKGAAFERGQPAPEL